MNRHRPTTRISTRDRCGLNRGGLRLAYFTLAIGLIWGFLDPPYAHAEHGAFLTTADCNLLPTSEADAFARPVLDDSTAGWVVSQRFANLVDPTCPEFSFLQKACLFCNHTGTDYAYTNGPGSSAGKSVYAIANGRVIFAGTHPTHTGNGGLIVIKHTRSAGFRIPSFSRDYVAYDEHCQGKNNFPPYTIAAPATVTQELFSYYLHLDPSSIRVVRGQEVSIGEQLAQVANASQIAFSPHLHFELWADCPDRGPNGYDPKSEFERRVSAADKVTNIHYVDYENAMTALNGPQEVLDLAFVEPSLTANVTPIGQGCLPPPAASFDPNGDLLVVWPDGWLGGEVSHGLHGRRLSWSDPNTSDQELVIAEDSYDALGLPTLNYLPQIAVQPSGTFIVVWQRAGNDLVGSTQEVISQRFDTSGTAMSAANTLAGTLEGFAPLDDGGYAVAWEASDGDINVGFFNFDMSPRSTPTIITDATSIRRQMNVKLRRLSSGVTAAVYPQRTVSSGIGLGIKIFEASSSKVTSTHLPSTDGLFLLDFDLAALTPDRLLVAWVTAFPFPRDGQTQLQLFDGAFGPVSEPWSLTSTLGANGLELSRLTDRAAVLSVQRLDEQGSSPLHLVSYLVDPQSHSDKIFGRDDDLYPCLGSTNSTAAATITSYSESRVAVVSAGYERGAFPPVVVLRRYEGVRSSEADLDSDGIVDSNDSCPGTPQGATSDGNGCSCAQKTCADTDSCTADGCDDVTAQCTFPEIPGCRSPNSSLRLLGITIQGGGSPGPNGLEIGIEHPVSVSITNEGPLSVPAGTTAAYGLFGLGPLGTVLQFYQALNLVLPAFGPGETKQVEIPAPFVGFTPGVVRLTGVLDADGSESSNSLDVTWRDLVADPDIRCLVEVAGVMGNVGSPFPQGQFLANAATVHTILVRSYDLTGAYRAILGEIAQMDFDDRTPWVNAGRDLFSLFHNMFVLSVGVPGLGLVSTALDEISGLGCFVTGATTHERFSNLLMGLTEGAGRVAAGAKERFLAAFVMSPSDLIIVDSAGRESAVTDAGVSAETIPGSDGALIPLTPPVKIVTIRDADDDYSLRLEGQTDGNTTLVVFRPLDESGAVQELTYEAMPTTPGSIATLDASASALSPMLMLDVDGDTIFESAIAPTLSQLVEDADADGVSTPADCNDRNPNIAPTLCDLRADGIDRNCDGTDDCATNCVCGFARGELTITASDALIALRTAVGSQACANCICDVDSSSQVTATDALLLLRTAVGAGSPLHCPVCSELCL